MSVQNQSLKDLLAAIEAADVEKLSREQQAAALFEGTRCLYFLAEKRIVPVAVNLMERTEYELALWATYSRMTLLLQGLVQLPDPVNFQFAAIIARTIFELLLDLRLLDDDPALSTKFFAFADVSKFRKTSALVEFLRQNPSVESAPHQAAVQFATDPQRRQRIEQQCLQLWGTNKKGKIKWPEHWTGESIEQRARIAGPEFLELYRSQFFLQSHFVHAGPAGIQGLSRDALVCLHGICHALIQRLFSQATIIVCRRFHLFEGDPKLRDELDRAASLPGFFAVKELLKQQTPVGLPDEA